jgi:hypothetical protein
VQEIVRGSCHIELSKTLIATYSVVDVHGDVSRHEGAYGKIPFGESHP